MNPSGSEAELLDTLSACMYSRGNEKSYLIIYSVVVTFCS